MKNKGMRTVVSLGAAACIMGCALIGGKPETVEASQRLERYETVSPWYDFRASKGDINAIIKRKRANYHGRLDAFFANKNISWDKLDDLRHRIDHTTDEKDLKFLGVAVDALILEWQYKDFLGNNRNQNQDLWEKYRNLQLFYKSLILIGNEDKGFHMYFAQQRNALDDFKMELTNRNK
ncbi:hypothetical protein [Atopobacter phocae]|uniref:hypothetical protein n=1 Tax=Atopobacter phocae TaxID=136492 RepID=UPI00046EDA15|nr:hypothetical protein [Atopobacter phocae]